MATIHLRSLLKTMQSMRYNPKLHVVLNYFDDILMFLQYYTFFTLLLIYTYVINVHKMPNDELFLI